MNIEYLYISRSLEIMHPETHQQLIKFGKSTKGIPERMHSLSSAGVPGKYECIAYLECENCSQAEAYLKNVFKDLWYNGEFFAVTPKNVILVMQNMPGKLVVCSDLPQKRIRKPKRKKPTPEPSDEIKTKITKLFDKKWNQKEISLKLKVSPYHVSKVVNSHKEKKIVEIPWLCDNI